MPVKRDNSKRAKNVRDTLKDTYSTCFFCGDYIPREERTIDHLKALAEGGLDHPSNMVVSCKQCNCEKADLPLYTYVKLKLENFDFKGRAEENKRKRGYGFEGAIYEELIVPTNKLIFRPKTPPNTENVEKRLSIYREENRFTKPTYVKKKGNKYVILQGFINYIIVTQSGKSHMPVTLVKNA